MYWRRSLDARTTHMSIWKKAPVHMEVSVVNLPKFMSAVEIE